MVTGGAGFIGSNFIRLALSRGCSILNIDKLTYAAGPDMLAESVDNADYQFIREDLNDTAQISQALERFRPTAIVHFAAETHVDRSIVDPTPFIHSNVLATGNLLQVALKYWKALEPEAKGAFRLVHISTDEVFGALGQSGSFNESSRYDPHSPYAATKAASDHLVRAFYHTYQFPVILVHPSNNYGPNQHPEKLIPLVIRCCILNQSIPIYGTGSNVRDWLYVEDHCQAIMELLIKGRIGESYSVGGGNEWQNLQLVRKLCDLIDELLPRPLSFPARRELISLVSDRPGHDFRYSLDCSKIKNELGWMPSHNGLEGFRKTIEWYMQNIRRLNIPNSEIQNG